MNKIASLIRDIAYKIASNPTKVKWEVGGVNPKRSVARVKVFDIESKDGTYASDAGGMGSIMSKLFPKLKGLELHADPSVSSTTVAEMASALTQKGFKVSIKK